MAKTQIWEEIKRVPLPDDYKGEQQITFSLRDEKSPLPLRGESPLSILKYQIENDNILELTVAGLDIRVNQSGQKGSKTG